ncbi:hypothetical protein G7K_5997-t1 [Saitoella complicata NRRL Y-17804]|uniref:Uncharacterized protein n=1 Tax=Saitoella complicata (strain BCRC 22490 / CBS 7301 / JCM 7358 / NBRC 10748 / NRRL Y-17804) TaxID=698492 RepID=A0A0E9NPZ9_SAICN|nr:hypothetical protein G7K_5997-t1 [Saitoella complicata NRRL Y-17804]
MKLGVRRYRGGLPDHGFWRGDSVCYEKHGRKGTLCMKSEISLSFFLFTFCVRYGWMGIESVAITCSSLRCVGLGSSC